MSFRLESGLPVLIDAKPVYVIAHLGSPTQMVGQKLWTTVDGTMHIMLADGTTYEVGLEDITYADDTLEK
jgi:hypothetical protein